MINILWLRRDLRLEDNAAAWHALKSGRPVQVIFIFDKNILDKLANRNDARVTFIHQELIRIEKQLIKLGSSLMTYYENAEDAWKQIVSEYSIEKVFANRDYEPYAVARDKMIYEFLKSKDIEFHGYKDQVIFEKGEVMKDDGTPYTVFTPYSRKWKEMLNPFYIRSYPTEKYFGHFNQSNNGHLHNLHEIGFIDSHGIEFPARDLNSEVIGQYENTRDFPAVSGTSRLSLHLRFGTISIRHLVRFALEKNGKFLEELIWREFYQMILYHFPYTSEKSFKPLYDRIQWENDEKKFKLWCKGKTGYPMVDAGMRELNETGYMHNRVRMVVASFLTKHLLIDWRWGEAYFAEKLLDYEMASNVGGWQWSAGCGCDAAPYFRIFNPASQAEKFDAKELYQRKWIPELGSKAYPKPIVDHKTAREKCLQVYKQALLR